MAIEAHDAHVRHSEGFCGVCGAALFGKRAGQRYCSGKCRAEASRRLRRSRMQTDLEELRRKIDAMLAAL